MKDKKRDSITMWNSEALKHHMSYGHYRAAVECGALPPPKWYEPKRIPELTQIKPDTQCPICGVWFHRARVNQICCSAECKERKDMNYRNNKAMAKRRVHGND